MNKNKLKVGMTVETHMTNFSQSWGTAKILYLGNSHAFVVYSKCPGYPNYEDSVLYENIIKIVEE